MSIASGWPQVLDFFGIPHIMEPSWGQLSIRQFDQRVGLTQSFAAALDDPRDPDLTGHSFLEMVRARVYGILTGYEDQNDHDTLPADPVLKLLADRSPNYQDLASEPALSRFESGVRPWPLRLTDRTACCGNLPLPGGGHPWPAPPPAAPSRRTDHVQRTGGYAQDKS
jgi:hypothetical protein